MIAGRGKTRIRPPRRGLAGNEVDFETKWTAIEKAFREIHTQNASGLSYEELYRDAYQVVLKKKGEELYTRVSRFEHEWLSGEVRASILAHISPQILTTLGVATPNERRVAGERFLKGLKEAWGHHQVCMSMISDVLMYMDRVYCSDNHRPNVYTTAMALFRDDVLKSRISKDDPNNPDADHRAVLDLLNRVILDQIQMERDGDVIDKHLIKSCVYMLESLYDDESDSRDQRLYHLSFEREYLAMSRQFYRDEAESLIREADAGAYCRHARRRLYEEQDRCQSTLLESTADKILKVVEEELIKNRIKEVVEMESGVHFMIDNDRLDELNLIYTLEALVDDKKTELTRAIQQRIISLGEEVNSSAIAASTATPAAPETGDKAKGAAQERSINQQTVAAIQWVEDVLQLKDKFDSIWKMSFQQDNVMQTAMTRSFADFINSTNFPRSSEYISLFIDENMKKGIKGKTEMEIDAVLEKAIILLRYVQDKDLFERYYKKHLCRRLLMNKSISNEVEKQMISKMKIELGNNFTMKLEAMFKDMTISEELTCGFKKHVDGLGEKDPRRIELAINVLTSMTWPLETMGSAADDNNNTGGRPNIVFPPAIDRIKRGFEKYYNEKHSGRQLTWLANMGSADLKAVFPRVAQKDGSFKERRHDLNVSTYGMLILLLFNDLSPNASLTFEDIQAQTNIPTSDLIRNLQSLAVAPKTRILLKEPMSKDVKPTDRFSFNEGFSGKFVKIKVGVVASGNKVESDRERRETEKKNDDSRAFCVEAAVVRIMKQRKELPHQQLVMETLSQLAGQFRPDVGMVKKRIESLIEREYLERIEGAKVDSYRYLA